MKPAIYILACLFLSIFTMGIIHTDDCARQKVKVKFGGIHFFFGLVFPLSWVLLLIMFIIDKKLSEIIWKYSPIGIAFNLGCSFYTYVWSEPKKIRIKDTEKQIKDAAIAEVEEVLAQGSISNTNHL